MRKAVLIVVLLLFSGPAYAQPKYQIYYTYAAFGARDVHGNPVIDPGTGKQIQTGVCIVWKSYYTKIDNPDVEILGSNFYSKYSYRVDPRDLRLTIYSVEAPRVVAITSGTGWFPVGGNVDFQTNITVPLDTQPQAQWPCSAETWKLALSIPDRYYLPPPVILPSGFRPIPSSYGPTYNGKHAVSGSVMPICPPGTSHGAGGYCY